jgi:uncharacterized protein
VISQEDLDEVSRQLGRPARDIIEVAARCVCKRPLVVKTKPRLEDGTPFPTLYYLTQKSATAAVSALEAEGYMTQLQRDLLEDDKLSNAYNKAHLKYLQERDEIEVVDEIDGISAGGMPYRVKCLHALVAHSLASGKGTNPVGDLALAKLEWSPKVCTCL